MNDWNIQISVGGIADRNHFRSPSSCEQEDEISVVFCEGDLCELWDGGSLAAVGEIVKADRYGGSYQMRMYFSRMDGVDWPSWTAVIPGENITLRHAKDFALYADMTITDHGRAYLEEQGHVE